MELKKLFSTWDFFDQGIYSSVSKALLEGAFVSITDEKGFIVSANKLFADFTQFSEPELIGKKHKEVLSDFHTKEFWYKMIKTVKAGQIWNEDVKINIQNGEAKWLHSIVGPVVDSEGNVSRIVHIQFDISSYKKLLKHEESLKEIAFIQSHEFRRPVANMLGIFDLISSDPECEKLPSSILLLLEMLKQSVKDTDEIIAKIVLKAAV